MKRDRIELQVPFAQIPRWIIESPDLSDRAVRLYGVLHRWAGLPEGIIPGRAKLASFLRDCSTRAVTRATAELVDVGAVVVRKRLNDRGEQTSNEYVLMATPESNRIDTPVQGVGTPVSNNNDTLSNDKKMPAFPKEQTQPMYAVFVELFGTPVGSMQAAFGLTVNEALAAGIRPDEVGPAARRYRERWPSVACSPMALVKHWNTFGPEAHLLSVPVEVRDNYRRV